jgi:hypothetical protein
MPFVLSLGAAFDEGATFDEESGNHLENNCSANNGGQKSETSSTIYNI